MPGPSPTRVSSGLVRRNRPGTGAQGEDHLPSQAVPPLRRRPLHRRSCEVRAIEKRRRPGDYRSGSAPGASCARMPAPHDAIYFNEDLNIAQKCTGCAHLLDNDPDWKMPRCVDDCPTGALRSATRKSSRTSSKRRSTCPRVAGKTRVYYKGLPKKFIGGTLYDPGEGSHHRRDRDSEGHGIRRDLHGRHRRLRGLLVPRAQGRSDLHP